jgi:hypothetical protein
MLGSVDQAAAQKDAVEMIRMPFSVKVDPTNPNSY